MNTMMRNLAVLVPMALAVTGCATMTDAQRLAKFETYAGEPVKQIRYFSPIGWEEVDDDHVILSMRPTEAYLVRLSGPCLDYSNGAAAMLVTNSFGWIQNKFDHVSFGREGFSCRIEEIRPVDVAAMRAANQT